MHVDLYHVVADQPVETVLPLEFEGEPVGVKQGGVLQIQRTEGEVRCLPRHLPNRLSVPVGHLNVGDHLYVRDLQLPDALELLTDPDEMVLTILEVRKEDAEATVSGPAAEPVEEL